MIKASLSYGNYRRSRRLAVGHAKGEREQTTRALPWFPPVPKLHRFLIPHTPHPTPHTPHLRSLLKTYPCEGVGSRESGVGSWEGDSPLSLVSKAGRNIAMNQ
ncbi:MAG: hypothetical protein F6J98_21660 [Moorea sp. SIO4G2]|nr:hypothetical protein [Moorena sp. SIO4A3]NEO62899.1 hypothetical protein [Moorena sp. SIO4G2]